MTTHIVADYTYAPRYMHVTYCGALLEHDAEHANPEPDVTNATCITCLCALREKTATEIRAWSEIERQANATIERLTQPAPAAAAARGEKQP